MKIEKIINNKFEIVNNEKKDCNSVISIVYSFSLDSRLKVQYFSNSIESILSQTNIDIELILIDDKSEFGNDEIIKFSKNPRVKVIRNSQKIGIPAISLYKGALELSGEYVMFITSFPVFEKNSLSTLLGYFKTNEIDFIYGDVPFDYFVKDSRGDLGPANFLGDRNLSATILKKDVVRAFGVLNPHFLAIDQTEILYHRMLIENFNYKKINQIICHDYFEIFYSNVTGAGVIQNFFFNYTQKSVKLENFLSYDITKSDSIPLRLKADFLHLRNSFNHFFWFDNTESYSFLDKKIISVFGSYDASVALTFNSLKIEDDFVLNYVEPFNSTQWNVERLLCSDIVIVVRILFGFDGVVNFLNTISKPLYYFVDDNFVLLSSEIFAYQYYTINNMQNQLKQYDGVFVSTLNLKTYYLDKKLHKNVVLLAPSLDEKIDRVKICDISKKAERKKINIGLIGGEFRKTFFEKTIAPALLTLSKDYDIHLYSRFPLKNFNCTVIEANPCFEAFINKWSKLNLDFIIHPKGETTNISYKADSVIFISYYLSAIPIVYDEPAFEHIPNSEFIKVFNGSENLISEFQALFDMDSGKVQKIFESFKQWCFKRYSKKDNFNILLNLVSKDENEIQYDEYSRVDELWKYIKLKDSISVHSSIDTMYTSYGKLDFFKMLIAELIRHLFRIVGALLKKLKILKEKTV